MPSLVKVVLIRSCCANKPKIHNPCKATKRRAYKSYCCKAYFAYKFLICLLTNQRCAKQVTQALQIVDVLTYKSKMCKASNP